MENAISTDATSQPRQGLWAYHAGVFHALYLDAANRKIDHVTWFRSLGLPDVGHDFDRVLRGRMTWDWHTGKYLLVFYGGRHLPNQVYQMVQDRFNPQGARVIERPARQMNWY